MTTIKNFFVNIFSTIYNFKFYQKVSKDDATTGILFVAAFDFFIILIFSLILAIIAFPFMPKAEKYAVKYIQENMPKLILKNGELRSDIKQPYVFIKVEDFAVVIDTTGKTTDLPKEFNYGLFIGKNKVRFKKNTHEIREYSFNEVKNNFIIDKKFSKDLVHKVFHYIKMLYFPFVLFLSPFILIVFLIVQLITALYMSILGLLVNIFTKVKINFEGIFNMCVYLLIPVTIISITTSFFLDFIPFKTTIVTIIYLLAIFKSFQSEKVGNLDI